MMITRAIPASLLLFSSAALAVDLPPPPPQPDATEAIAKQIGWLVIQNANLQMQIDALKKQVAECGK